MPEMQKGDFADADAAVTVPDSASPSLFSDAKIWESTPGDQAWQCCLILCLPPPLPMVY